MIDEIIELIDSYWKFDNDQQHLSTWHDKQELIEAVKQVKNCNAPAVSKSDSIEREALFALLKWMQDEPIFNIDSIDEILDDYDYYKANCC